MVVTFDREREISSDSVKEHIQGEIMYIYIERKRKKIVDQQVIDNKSRSVRGLVFLATAAACAEQTKAITLMWKLTDPVKLMCNAKEMKWSSSVLCWFAVRVRNGLDAEAAGFLGVNSDTLVILSTEWPVVLSHC